MPLTTTVVIWFGMPRTSACWTKKRGMTAPKLNHPPSLRLGNRKPVGNRHHIRELNRIDHTQGDSENTYVFRTGPRR